MPTTAPAFEIASDAAAPEATNDTAALALKARKTKAVAPAGEGGRRTGVPEVPADSPWMPLPDLSDELCRVDGIMIRVQGRGTRVLLRARTLSGVTFQHLDGFSLTTDKSTGEAALKG